MKANFLVVFLLCCNASYAQQTSSMKKETSGRYLNGSTEGIYVYDDGSFALFGYATLLLGSYTIEADRIHFTPRIPKQPFYVLGRKDMALKMGTRLWFTAEFFYDGPTFIQVNTDSVQPLFNTAFNSGESDYVIQLDEQPATITLAHNRSEQLHTFNANRFRLDSSMNDYLLFYTKTVREQAPFTVFLNIENGTRSFEYSSGLFTKEVNKVDEEWERFIDNCKQQQGETDKGTTFYFNDQLKSATGFNYSTEKPSVFDIDNYVLDTASNKWVVKSSYKKGENYLNEKVKDYHDETYILAYKKLPLKDEMNIDFRSTTISSLPLFLTDYKKTKPHHE